MGGSSWVRGARSSVVVASLGRGHKSGGEWRHRAPLSTARQHKPTNLDRTSRTDSEICRVGQVITRMDMAGCTDDRVDCHVRERVYGRRTARFVFQVQLHPSHKFISNIALKTSFLH